ncbi:MAG: hypothetical protein IJR26_05395 [Bacteroidales bacterium]|nr:hypothetical protein [Bacteroidales bacterium]
MVDIENYLKPCRIGEAGKLRLLQSGFPIPTNAMTLHHVASAKLGSFAVGGRDSHPDQGDKQGDLRILRRCNFYWRSWEASPPIPRNPSHSAKV